LLVGFFSARKFLAGIFGGSFWGFLGFLAVRDFWGFCQKSKNNLKCSKIEKINSIKLTSQQHKAYQPTA
jgi:hypothetical protein